VGEVTALTWALEVGEPQRFGSIAHAVSYCGLTSALRSSAERQQRTPLSKQRNVHLQTVLIEAPKLAPRWNEQLAAVHERELQRGHRNRATLKIRRSEKLNAPSKPVRADHSLPSCRTSIIEVHPLPAE
jgi:transposase